MEGDKYFKSIYSHLTQFRDRIIKKNWKLYIYFFNTISGVSVPQEIISLILNSIYRRTFRFFLDGSNSHWKKIIVTVLSNM
jgi:hypothetical protein